MSSHGAHRQDGSNFATEMRHLRQSSRRARRRDESARLAYTEFDIRRLDDRIDYLLELLAELCDYSGQFDAADDFRAQFSELVGAEPELRLVQET